MELREQQMDCVKRLRAAYASGARAPLLVAPTGSGKTVIFSWITASAAARGQNVLIIVHRKELLTQTSAKLQGFGVDHGFIAAGFPADDAAIRIASVQTLARRLDALDWSPDMIIVDEAHHAVGGNSWGHVLARFPQAKLLGLTATPERLDGRGIGVEAGGFFDALVIGPSVADQIERGYLSIPMIYAPPQAQVKQDIDGFESASEHELATMMDKPRIRGDAIAHYRQHSPGEPAIAFCVNLEHAHNLAAAFVAAGIPSAAIDGKLSDDERKTRIDDLARGRIHVLTSCQVVCEGVDIPVVSVAILLRPTQSLALHLQQVGRVLRPHPGKTRALILDHVGNTFRHGFPDDDREWRLSGRPKRKRDKKREFPIRQCERCFHVHKPAPQCPKCGYAYPVKTARIQEEAGDLIEIERKTIRLKQRKEQSNARTLIELREIGRRRGYKPGWADHVWRARAQKK